MLSATLLATPPPAATLPPVATPAPPRTITWASIERTLPRLDLLAALLLTVVAASLHWFLYGQHFPLWRDEVNTTQLATFPTFAETWKFLSYDSCPILFPGLVRAWTSVLPPSGDWNLRLLGFGIGLTILGAFWLCVRKLGGRVPLLTVALLGFNPAFIRYGDSVRPYGLGILMALLFLLTLWRVVESARPGRILLAAAAGILAVNSLFYNAVLVLAICVTGAAVVARDKRWKHATILLAIGLPAALSLLCYGAMIHEQHRWGFLLRYPVTVSWLWQRLSDVTGSPDPLGIWAWSALFLGLTGWTAYRVYLRKQPVREPGDRAAAFAVGVLLIGTVGYGLFLMVLNYRTQPWYYVTLMALAAVCLDVLYGRLIATAGPNAPRWQLARLALVFALVMLTYLQTKPDLLIRPTNLDIVAAEVTARADKDDLIIHTRWECAISFGHYYHGVAAQETLPPLADHRLHRYDQVMAQMMTPDAAKPVLDRMEKTLRDGHRIWLVGKPLFATAQTLPPVLKPLTLSAQGKPTMSGDYYVSWVMQACYLLEEHAAQVESIPVSAHGPVSNYENLSLSVLQGWTTN